MMKPVFWKMVAGGLGVAAGMAVRKILASIWPGPNEPPLNPADRRIDWQEAAGWAVASGIGAGLARTVSRRAAAAGWDKVFDESPPGVSAASTST
jgi:hypothetical protein